HNTKELQMPKFADDEELPSGWFELPDSVSVPQDEFLYAAAKDERNKKVTQRMQQESPDVTYLQIQRWADFVRPSGDPRPEPIGDWLVAEIKAHRGQLIGETTKIKLPLWSLVAGAFQFRDSPLRAPAGIFGPIRRAEPLWAGAFTPPA